MTKPSSGTGGYGSTHESCLTGVVGPNSRTPIQLPARSYATYVNRQAFRSSSPWGLCHREMIGSWSPVSLSWLFHSHQMSTLGSTGSVVVVTGGDVVVVVSGGAVVVVVGGVVLVVVGGAVVVVTGKVVVVTMVVGGVVEVVVVVVDGGTSRQLEMVSRFSLSIQWIPPSHGRCSDPFPSQMWVSVYATVGLTSGVS